MTHTPLNVEPNLNNFGEERVARTASCAHACPSERYLRDFEIKNLKLKKILMSLGDCRNSF